MIPARIRKARALRTVLDLAGILAILIVLAIGFLL